jgi:guanylate kinase
MSKDKAMGRVVVLSGPSCVGKSPLDKALGRFYPELHGRLRGFALYTSRHPRPGERDGVDYHFRAREQVEELRGDDRFIVLDVRGDLQALNVDHLMTLLEDGDAFFEGNPFVGRALQTHPRLEKVSRLSVFMSPLSRAEILYLRERSNISLPDFVTDVMRRKLLVRTRRHKKELSLKDLENIERRASSAYRELQDAHYFDYVIPNHDGEDSDNWDAFYYPLGDARKSLSTFAALLEGEQTDGVESWEPDLVP